MILAAAVESLDTGRGHRHTVLKHPTSLLWFHLGFLPAFDWKILLFIHFQAVDLLLGSRYQEYLKNYFGILFLCYYWHILYNFGTWESEEMLHFQPLHKADSVSLEQNYPS